MGGTGAGPIDKRGSGTLNLIGLVLKLTYNLRRHLWGAWSLAHWLGLLIAAGTVAAVFRFWPSFGPALLLGALLVAYVAFLSWAKRMGYVYYRVLSNPDVLLSDANPRRPLRPEELVPVQASGWFTVEGEDQYLVEIEADLKITGMGEWIIMGRVHPSRFLLLGRLPGYELGWWYMFFFPGMVQEMSVGHMHFGRHSRLALRVVHESDEEPRQTIYLTSDEAWVLHLVRDDLQREVSRAGRKTSKSMQGEAGNKEA
jgi:hypothetical protein